MKTNEVNKEISYETLLVTFGEGIGRLDTMFDDPQVWGVATLKQWIEVSPGEDRVMERLAQLQLVTPDDTGHEVRLTHFAFNPSLLDKLRK